MIWMKRLSIRQHLRPYSILARRRTTINHAFASALAANDDYEDIRVLQALRDLGQDPDADLVCFYCDEHLAETWDHVFGLVEAEQYAGFGHTVGNLVPCCKECNSRKGNRPWREYLNTSISDIEKRSAKISVLERYLKRYLDPRFGQNEIAQLYPDEMGKLQEKRQCILALMKEADDIAADIRAKVKLRNESIRAQGD